MENYIVKIHNADPTDDFCEDTVFKDYQSMEYYVSQECERLGWDYLGLRDDNNIVEVGMRTPQGEIWKFVDTPELYSIF